MQSFLRMPSSRDSHADGYRFKPLRSKHEQGTSSILSPMDIDNAGFPPPQRHQSTHSTTTTTTKRPRPKSMALNNPSSDMPVSESRKERRSERPSSLYVSDGYSSHRPIVVPKFDSIPETSSTSSRPNMSRRTTSSRARSPVPVKLRVDTSHAPPSSHRSQPMSAQPMSAQPYSGSISIGRSAYTDPNASDPQMLMQAVAVAYRTQLQMDWDEIAFRTELDPVEMEVLYMRIEEGANYCGQLDRYLMVMRELIGRERRRRG